MEERLLGRTGLLVPRLGVGCGAVGGLMVRGDAKEQSLAVAQALEAGVRYFDTAPSYGDGRSEENLGRALAAVDTNRSALVGTKVHLSAEHLSDVRSAIRRSLEDSCRRLGRDRVDLFQLHNQIRDPFDDPHRLGEVAAAMRQAVDDGLAGHIGFTGLGDTPAIRGALESAAFETVQTYFNAVNPSAAYPGATGGGQDFDGLVTTAGERQVGVINIRVYAAGALSAVQARHPIAGTVGGDPLAGSGYPEDVDRAVRLSALAAELALTGPLELGLRCALGAPGISVVLVGLSSLDHLQAAVRWEARPPLPAGVIDRVVALARR
jgi:aryl-alcohol dehydrogenase-like predicted oxidoreductase